MLRKLIIEELEEIKIQKTLELLKKIYIGKNIYSYDIVDFDYENNSYQIVIKHRKSVRGLENGVTTVKNIACEIIQLFNLTEIKIVQAFEIHNKKLFVAHYKNIYGECQTVSKRN